jgi:hypothetical protein
VTEIAQNQAITLRFSQKVDPASVNSASFSIKTASGESPAGSLIVEEGVITFVPEVRIVGGNTFFGFKANETYILTLPGGAGEQLSIRSVAGDRLASTLSCTLNVSRGIVDPDGRPPVATLIAPEQATNVPADVTVLLEFSEFIDTAPFQSGTAKNSPVEFRIVKTRAKNGGLPGERECDPQFQPLVLDGAPRAQINAAKGTTQVSFRPSIRLPSEVCVEVTVTSRVRDLAGTPAKEQRFTFITESSGSSEQTISEDFVTTRQRDADESSGPWANGALEPGLIGSDGSLGPFEATDGRQIGAGIYEWSTDSQLISGRNTRSGREETITDGVFRFSSFKLPAGIRVVFAGARPARILVRGNVQIEGTVHSNGFGTIKQNALDAIGQAGSKGGAGGGKGGQGADKGDGVANKPEFNGRHGEDVQLTAGHAYAGRAAGTGGRGSLQFPASGRNADVTHTGLQNRFSGQVASGGGGGGSRSAGAEGRAIKSNDVTSGPNLGPNTPGGIVFDAFPVPAGVSHLEHFLTGGSGGGGGGSHAFFDDLGQAGVTWWSGAGGTGGGGAVGFRAGSSFSMSVAAALVASGGNGADQGTASSTAGISAPGGAGSGGSFVIQVGGDPTLGGLIDVRGGLGGLINDPFISRTETRGGNGGAGVILLETPAGATVGQLGNTQPPGNAQNVGQLVDRDPLVGAQSLFYATGALFSPDWLRYIIRATVRGQRVIFCDDPGFTDPAWGPNVGPALAGQAIRFWVQGALVDPGSGLPDAGSLQPWRRYVRRTAGEDSLSGDQATGYRFQINFDRAIETDVEVNRVSVVFRT